MCVYIYILGSISNLFPTPPFSAWTVGLIPFKSLPKTNFSHGIHEDFNNNNDYAAVQPCRAPHPSPPSCALPSTHFLSDKTTSGGQRPAGSPRCCKSNQAMRSRALGWLWVRWKWGKAGHSQLPHQQCLAAFHRSGFPDTACNENGE